MTATARSRGRREAVTAYEDPRGSGWIVFAGTMLALVGSLNIISGISAISNSKFWNHGGEYVFGNLKTWGWVLLLTGAAQLLTAFGVWARNRLSAWVGIAFATLNAFGLLLMISAYPLYALALFSVDVLIIYGLAVYCRPEE